MKAINASEVGRRGTSAAGCGRLALCLALFLACGAARGGDEVVPFRVGLMHDVASTREREVARALERIAASSERCFSRRITILLAHGTYAQVYAWMKRGLVDGAVVSGVVGTQLLTLSDSDEASPFSPALTLEPRHEPEARMRCLTASGTRTPALYAYDAWLGQLVAAATGPPGGPSPDWLQVRFVDHLSTTGFVIPMLHAAEFLDDHGGLLKDDQKSDFWRRLLDAVEFSFFQERAIASGVEAPSGRAVLDFGDAGPSREDWEPLELLRKVVLPNDVLVVANSFGGRLAADGPTSGWPCAAAAVNAGGTFPKAFYREVFPASRNDLDPPYRALRERVDASLGSQPHLRERLRDWLVDNRHDYTLESALRLFTVDARLSGIDRLALVLPGGGVKATYQAVFLDHLYCNGRLRHEEFCTTPGALTVRTVVGTSGGAITGLFVASKKDAEDTLLPLWFDGARARIGPGDVLQPLSILRSFGVLLALIVVWSVLSVRLLVKDLPGAAVAPLEGRRLLAVTLTAAVILVGPVFITVLSTSCADFVARLEGRRVDLTNAWADSADFPWQLGVLHFLNLGLCHFCISRPSGLRQRELPPGRLGSKRYGLRWVDLGVLALHVLLALGVIALLSVVVHWKNLFPVNRKWFLYAFTCALTVFCVDAVYQPLRDYWEADRRRFLRQLALTVLFLALLVGMTFVPSVLGLAIETEFFYWVLLGALALAAGFLLAFSEITRLTGLSSFLAERHLYLARPWRRISSFVLLGALGFLFWNLTLAPALYNRGIAKRTLERQFRAWTGLTVRRQPPVPVRLGAEFVVAATAVEPVTFPAGKETMRKEDGDLYVLYPFQPGSAPPPLADRPLPGRWVTGLSEAAPLLDVVFSSGAAFPVFAPSVVTRAGFDSVLIDGGFTHNVPIEAAQERGARQVLVVHASPRPPASETPSRSDTDARFRVYWRRIIGPFARRLPTIPGLLFERAQAVDVRAQRDLLVAEVVPRAAPSRSFPNLASFSTANISNLQKWAREDLDRSVVWVESWGLPVFSILDSADGPRAPTSAPGRSPARPSSSSARRSE